MVMEGRKGKKGRDREGGVLKAIRREGKGMGGEGRGKKVKERGLRVE